MHNFLEITSQVDVLPLLLAIRRQPQLWTEDTYLRHYPMGPFGEVETIMLRFPKKVVFEGDDAKKKVELYKANQLAGHDQHESIPYPPWNALTEAQFIVMGLMSRVAGTRLGRVMINKIVPGGRIHRHADSPEHANYWDRFHVVLDSAAGARFLCGDEEVYMPVGTVWWFQNALEHEVINNSDRDRIHMVVDIRCKEHAA